MIKARSMFLLVVLVASGCVSYMPADLSDLSRQDKVRIELDPAELAELIRFADPATRSVTGRLVNTSADSVAVVLRTPSSYAQVSIPRTSIVQTHKAVSDNRKSFAVSAIIVGGIAALAVAGFQGRDNTPGGDGNGIDETLIPLIRWRFPFNFGFGR